jgi:hypothetical protein
VGDHLVIEGYDAKVSIKVARGATLSIVGDVYLNGGSASRCTTRSGSAAMS